MIKYLVFLLVLAFGLPIIMVYFNIIEIEQVKDFFYQGGILMIELSKKIAKIIIEGYISVLKQFVIKG